MSKDKSLKGERLRREKAGRPGAIKSTLGSRQMYRNGKLVTKPSTPQDFKPARKPSTPADPNRKLYKQGIKSRKSGTKKAN